MPDVNFFGLLIWVVLAFGGVLLFLKWKQWKQEKEKMEKIKKSGIRDIDRMDKTEFEIFIKMLFANIDFTARSVKPAESGLGADFFLEGETKAVLKLVPSGANTRVGLKAVQEIHAARTLFDVQEAWLITNTVFTEKAKMLGEKCGVKLIDRFLLQKLILVINPEANAREVRESVQLLFREAFWQKEQEQQKREGVFVKAEEPSKEVSVQKAEREKPKPTSEVDQEERNKESNIEESAKIEVDQEPVETQG
ncbi:restriction endonuclease [Bacillus badius]|uniref:restriction endonuclease n=1 Tax=Bacillus badius TaxID=1455 RepID=UPI0006980384|nr:restriction endonuclease [Bacillus badius]